MLPLASRSPERVEETGRHAGFDYVLMRNRFGTWLAYVRFPDGHPLGDRGGDDPDCHGGVTWMSSDDDGRGTWKGWDYGHAEDRPDPYLLAKLPDEQSVAAAQRMDMMGEQMDGHVWTATEVRADAAEVCEQARAALGPDTVPVMLARAILNGDLSATDALVDWWIENKRPQ